MLFNSTFTSFWSLGSSFLEFVIIHLECTMRILDVCHALLSVSTEWKFIHSKEEKKNTSRYLGIPPIMTSIRLCRFPCAVWFWCLYYCISIRACYNIHWVNCFQCEYLCIQCRAKIRKYIVIHFSLSTWILGIAIASVAFAVNFCVIGAGKKLEFTFCVTFLLCSPELRSDWMFWLRCLYKHISIMFRDENWHSMTQFLPSPAVPGPGWASLWNFTGCAVPGPGWLG